MTTFYKLTDIITDDKLYLNPKTINFYMYTNDGVMIDTDSIRIEVSKEDFEFMLLMEGIDECWHTPQFIEFQLITEIELFYWISP